MIGSLRIEQNQDHWRCLHGDQYSLPYVTFQTLCAVCHFALDVMQALEEYYFTQKHPRLDMRIGINVGPCKGGHCRNQTLLVRYLGRCGELCQAHKVNGVPGTVHVTQSVLHACTIDEFTFTRRGLVDVKGIGKMDTYFFKAVAMKRKQHRIAIRPRNDTNPCCSNSSKEPSSWTMTSWIEWSNSVQMNQLN